MGNQVPTLSASGWTNDVSEKADKLMSYYFVSEASQSNMYLGNITSLPYQIQQNGHNEVELQRMVQKELEGLFGRYFDTAVVEVSTDKPLANDPNRINLRVSVIVTEGGRNYSLGRLVEVLNSNIQRIVDINNNQGG